MRIVDRKEVGAALEAFCDKFETYKEAAKKLGITLSQLSAARNKPKSVVPAKALKKLGFEFKAVYLAKDTAPKALSPPVLRAAKSTKVVPARKRVTATRTLRLPTIQDVQPEPPTSVPACNVHTPDWSGLRRAYGECKVCGAIIEPANPPVAPVEPDNPDIYVPDDKGNNTPILPEPEIDESEEPMFDADGYPIYR